MPKDLLSLFEKELEDASMETMLKLERDAERIDQVQIPEEKKIQALAKIIQGRLIEEVEKEYYSPPNPHGRISS